MNPTFLPTAVLVSVIMLVSCDNNSPKEQQSLMETSKQELALAVQERDCLLALVKEISADLNRIKDMDSAMTVTMTQNGRSPRQRSRILNDIEAVRQTMLLRKARLAEVEQELANSTLNNKELTEIIDAFRMQVDSQIAKAEELKRLLLSANRHIDSLSNEVDSLSTTVASVTSELDMAQQTSVMLENKLNTCYYVVAPKAVLKEHNIIESGFLRRTKLLKGDFDKSCFTVSDKRLLTALALHSSKVRLLTNHPEAAYELVNDNGSMILKITAPEQFWSLSSYLVIQTD